MFRSFISWRYLRSRRTNLIGVAGVFVALVALIVIISIMTGFLETSRQHVRGSLSDLLIEPNFDHDGSAPELPGPLLDVVRAHPEVQAATAQIQWAGLILGESELYERVMSNSYFSGLLFVQLVGVDVRNAERLLVPAMRMHTAAVGGLWSPYVLQDEFDTTEFGRDLAYAAQGLSASSEGLRFSGAPVANRLFPFVPPANYRPTSRPAKGVVVGWQLARTLGLAPGDELRIASVVPDPENGWVVNNRDFVVTGTFRSRDNETDRMRLYVERDELSDFLGGTRTYTHVLAKLDDYDHNGVRVRDELRAQLVDRGLLARADGSVVQTWEDFRGNLLGAIENERVLMGIMLSLVLLVSGFTIFAILSMMVTEKRRDIGILRALGATPQGIRQLFLMIAFWDALVGAVLGTVVGVLAAQRIDAIERAISGLIGYQIFDRDVYLFDHIPSIVPPFWIGVFVLGAFLCCLVAALVPAWRASRIHPLDALRYE